ncbi:glycosyltransferase family 39 protein [Hymenobacter sp. BT559]|uniref:ArnT family glycosyltransferase n=1 Tax=Hymenobacter sp. BT559 TaxID=2795729 RepID=UPI0018EB30B7|nr:glycosyltransferase family 39 protein [Hymenobacter sp. BT559]MBJ6144799.1 glycosyltransferase family 39 protein [Hymenobacter sp. BT559]
MRSLEQYLGRQRAYRLLVLAVLGLGIFVRVWHFPSVPPGLNQDEAASAYEAYSLAETGCDKWGNPWPAYFPAWGSGQNVLLAYLTIPLVKVCGLSILSARLAALGMGLLTLPLFYCCLRPLGRRAALLGLLLLALAPWHFMLSRWGLESNLLPFWMLLGCACVGQAIYSQQRRWIIPSLLPFALALYAYGTTVVVLPTLLGVVLLGCFGRIKAQWWAWGLALGLFVLVAAPFLLFFAENYVLGRNLAWTDKLFFSTPVTLINRLDYKGLGSMAAIWVHNADFVVRSFDDDTNHNKMLDYPLLLRGTWGLTVVGVGVGLYRLRGLQQQWYTGQPAALVGLLVGAWGLACLPLFFLFELNVNRINHLFLPCLALAAWGGAVGSKWLPAGRPRQVFWGLLLSWFVGVGGNSVRAYFYNYPRSGIRKQFNEGLGPAFEAVRRLQGATQVRITSQIPLNYVYTLFYLQYPPARFRQEAKVEVVEGAYQVNKFDRYVFDDRYLLPGVPYAYLARRGEVQPSRQQHKVLSYSDELWEVGMMYGPAAAQ